MKFFCCCCWNRRQSSPGSSTSQRESFQSPGRPCWSATSLCSLKKIKSYKAFSKIHKAATLGDVATVEGRLILRKNDINDRDRNDRTLLHYACAYGHANVVALLIEWNCDIDLRDSDNSTALIKASQYEHEDCLAMLLEHGANPNAMDNSGNTALHYAVWHNSTSMTAKLLAHHADISIRNEDSFTPLILALIKNNDNLAKFLEDQKEKIKELDELDRSSEKTSNEKEEVKEQGNPVFDLTKLISSSEGNSGDDKLLSYDTMLQLIEEFRRQSKDTDAENLLQIWYAVHSHKRSMELQKRTCELIEEENKHISNDIIAMIEEESQIEFEIAKLRGELYNMRHRDENLELKSAIRLQAKENGQLSRTQSEKVKEEEFELNQSLTQSLHEVQRKNTELEEEISRYKNLCTVMEKDSEAHKDGEFSGYNASSTTHCKKAMILQLREEFESLKRKEQQEEFQCLCEENENTLLEQKLAEMTALQEKLEVQECRIKQLEEKILSLKTHMDKNMVEYSEVENHKKAIEEQQRSQIVEAINKVNQFLQDQSASDLQGQERQAYIMSSEHIIKEIEFEIVVKNSRTVSIETEWKTLKTKYEDGVKNEVCLRNQLVQ